MFASVETTTAGIELHRILKKNTIRIC